MGGNVPRRVCCVSCAGRECASCIKEFVAAHWREDKKNKKKKNRKQPLEESGFGTRHEREKKIAATAVRQRSRRSVCRLLHKRAMTNDNE